jgi:HD-GYP domain-containing protein (c-di-GMP phosphodiesterase class II)
MTSDRPYRRALSDRDAREEIAARAGTQFCPSMYPGANVAPRKNSRAALVIGAPRKRLVPAA